MKTVATLIFCLISFHSFSYSFFYPTDFISKINSNAVKDGELILLLKDILNKKHLVGNQVADQLVDECKEGETCYQKKTLLYSEARKYLFGKLHLKQNELGEYFIKDVYCNEIFNNQTPDINTIGPMLIPNHMVLNCEHTWPISRFSKDHSEDEQKTDLHHLFPAQTNANSVRENHKFGEITLYFITNLCRSSSFGINENIPITNFHRYVFEPPTEHKGNVARALFYFSIKYDLYISTLEEYYLRQWHADDPVDQEELQRNEEIYKIQNNRNPFIDFPQLVNLIDNF